MVVLEHAPFMNISTSDVSYPLDVLLTVSSVAPNAWRSEIATRPAYCDEILDASLFTLASNVFARVTAPSKSSMNSAI